MGIRYTSGRRGNVRAGLLNMMRSYLSFNCCTMARKPGTMSNSANIMTGVIGNSASPVYGTPTQNTLGTPE